MRKKLVIKEKPLENGQTMKCIYSMSFYYAELNCARMLYELQQAFDGADQLTQTQIENLEKKIKKWKKAVIWNWTPFKDRQ